MSAPDQSADLSAYGVFKPVGHVVIAFPDAADVDAAIAELGGAETIRYSPEQMIEQVQRDLDNAGALSGVGQELNLVRAHGELARQGSSFLVVKADGQSEVDRIADVAVRHNASRAQRYGRLLIEELIPVGSSDKQVAESNDRGLDSQTRSSREQAR